MIGIGQNLKFAPGVTVVRSGGTMDLDFAGAKSLTSTVGAAAVTFTRASTGTYVNSAGLIASAAVDEPRLTYDPVSLTSKGLLIEAAATNLLTYSEQFDNAAWTKTVYTVSANATTAPDGTLTADFLDEATTASADRFIHSLASGTISAGATCTASIYIKAGGRGYAQFRLISGNGTYSICYLSVNLSTLATINSGTVSGTFASASAIDAGSGWIRLSLTGALAGNVTLASL